MSFIKKVIDIFLHLDRYLVSWQTAMGGWLYAVLFAVVFAETGLVVTPFLPGDSLLFAAGALAALDGSTLQLHWLIISLIVAGVLGDAVNYSVGARIGPRVFHREDSWLLNKKHLLKAHEFYEKYGGKTIILARFVPIVRTFAPFVAGIGKMTYRRFASFNIIGAIAWVCIFSIAGYKFGGLPFIKRHFQFVILAIIILSVMPIVVEVWRERKKGKAERAAKAAAKSAPADPQ